MRGSISLWEEGGEKIADFTPLDEADGLQALALDLGNHRWFTYEIKTSEGEVLHSQELKIEYYPDPPEVAPLPDGPHGVVTRHAWDDSATYPETRREFEVYVPAQYDGSTPASLIVFQDGLRHAATNGSGLRVPHVLDHLIAAGDMPVTVGIFINPGHRKSQSPDAKPGNRGIEYDSLGDTYADFLLEEIIPFVESEHGVKLSSDPADRAIAGGSSGASCAWTVAWERPDQFGKVLGWVPSLVDLRGAHVYPGSLVRRTRPIKPIRVAFLAERNDLNNDYGNWPLANMQMESALEYAGYDYRYWWGDGFHGSKHAVAMLPEMLRWLWGETAER